MSVNIKTKVMLTIERPDGSKEHLVRQVTRTTGHHVFVRRNEAGSETRIASSTTDLCLHKSVPQFWVDAIVDHLGLTNEWPPAEWRAVSLRTFAMTADEVKQMKSRERKAKREAQTPRYYGMGIYTYR